MKKDNGPKEIKTQVDFVEALFVNLMLSFKEHIENIKNDDNPYWGKNYLNKNCGKTALLRKIIMLRQELLNLERMIERE